MLACFEVIWSLTTRVEVRRRERRYWRSMQAAARRWTAVPMNMTFDLSVWIVWSIQIVVSEPMTYGLRTYLKCRKVGLRGSEQSVEALNDTNSSVSSAYCWLIHGRQWHYQSVTGRWRRAEARLDSWLPRTEPWSTPKVQHVFGEHYWPSFMNCFQSVMWDVSQFRALSVTPNSSLKRWSNFVWLAVQKAADISRLLMTISVLSM